MVARTARLSIALEPATAAILSSLAKQQHKYISSLARELVLDALDRYEDVNLSKLAEIRDTNHAKKISHNDAWR